MHQNRSTALASSSQPPPDRQQKPDMDSADRAHSHRQLFVRSQSQKCPTSRLPGRNHLQLRLGQFDQDELEWSHSDQDTVRVCGPHERRRAEQVLHVSEWNICCTQQRRHRPQLLAHTVHLGRLYLLPCRCLHLCKF